MRIAIFFMVSLILVNLNGMIFAENLYLDGPNNAGTLRIEIDNDTIWNKDNNFTNGWSIQYHTIRYANWEASKNPGFIKWVGENFPTLDNEGFIVRNCHGIGQNMITPGDLNAETPQEGDLPYQLLMLDTSILGDSLIWEITQMNGQAKYPLFQASLWVICSQLLRLV